MEDRLDDLPVRPATVPDMIHALETMWSNLNPQIDTLPYIMSLPTRIKGVIRLCNSCWWLLLKLCI